MSDDLLTLCEQVYFPLNLRIHEPTRYQYRIMLRDYSTFLGRPCTKADLTDDQVTLWQSKRLADGLAPRTVKERAGRIQTLWTWMAKRRMVEMFPTFAKPRVPKGMPVALSEDELRRFFRSAKKERGLLAGIPSDLWCVSYFAFVLNSSERKSAAMAIEIGWLNLDSRVCVVPPDVRKGGIKGAVYPLWPETAILIRACIAVNPNRVLVWPWDKCEESYYTLYNRILRDAGLPVTRKYKTHSLRVSHNTWHKVMTGQHSPLLGHSDSATSETFYEDKRFTTKDMPPFFIPWQEPPEPRS